MVAFLSLSPAMAILAFLSPEPPAPSHCPFGRSKKREAPQLGYLCPSYEKGPLMQRSGWPQGLCRTLQTHQSSGLVARDRAGQNMQETEVRNRHLVSGLGLRGGRAGVGVLMRGTDHSSSPSPSDAQALPRLRRGAGWGMEEQRHHVGSPLFVKSAVSSRASGSGETAPLCRPLGSGTFSGFDTL